MPYQCIKLRDFTTGVDGRGGWASNNTGIDEGKPSSQHPAVATARLVVLRVREAVAGLATEVVRFLGSKRQQVVPQILVYM